MNALSTQRIDAANSRRCGQCDRTHEPQRRFQIRRDASQDRPRIVFDCRMTDDPAMMSSTIRRARTPSMNHRNL